MAAQAMKAGLEILKPLLADGASRRKGTVVIGTVKGDLHDIGKTLVSMMMEGAGFDGVELGEDVASEALVRQPPLRWPKPGPMLPAITAAKGPPPKWASGLPGGGTPASHWTCSRPRLTI